MKNILIGGSCRSGKTLLGLELKKHLKNYNYFSIDWIRNALNETFNKNFGKDDVETLNNYIFNLFRKNKKFNEYGVYCIFEGIYVAKEELRKRNLIEDNIIIFVGKPNLTPEEFFKFIRKNEKTYRSWTSEQPDDEILEMTKNSYVTDNENKKFCEEHGLIFLDTSFNQMKVIKDFVKDFTSSIKYEK